MADEATRVTGPVFAQADIDYLKELSKKQGDRTRMQKLIEFATRDEREYQDKKWGTVEERPHDVAGWLLIMEGELAEAKQAWIKGVGDKDALLEILQVIAVGVACLEQHGVVERKPPEGRPDPYAGKMAWDSSRG